MDLKIHNTSIEAISVIRPLVIIVERFDNDLGKQIRRSSTSVPLNIAEGAYSQVLPQATVATCRLAGCKS